MVSVLKEWGPGRVNRVTSGALALLNLGAVFAVVNPMDGQSWPTVCVGFVIAAWNGAACVLSACLAVGVDRWGEGSEGP